MNTSEPNTIFGGFCLDLFDLRFFYWIGSILNTKSKELFCVGLKPTKIEVFTLYCEIFNNGQVEEDWSLPLTQGMWMWCWMLTSSFTHGVVGVSPFFCSQRAFPRYGLSRWSLLVSPSINPKVGLSVRISSGHVGRYILN